MIIRIKRIDNHSHLINNPLSNFERVITEMYVCLCRNVTDKDIRQLVHTEGVTTMRELREHLGVSTQCGKCSRCAKEVLQEAVCELRHGQSHGQRNCIPILSAAA